MVFKWREAHTSLVLSLLKNHECLWNRKCVNYKKKDKREQALEEMVKKLNLPLLTIEDIKLKIKTIRTRYASELNKVMKSERCGAGDGDIYVPKLYWFKEADLFLRSVCIPRSLATEIPTRDDKAEEDNEESNCYADNILVKEEMDEESQRKQRNLNHSFKPPLRKRIALDRAIDKLNKIFKEGKEETEFDAFCKSLALQLNKMPLERAIICQQQLQNVMTQERIYQIQAGAASSSLNISPHYEVSHD